MLEKLNQVLLKFYGKKITDIDYKRERLHGGDVGDVQLITGIAETTNREKLPFKLVLKIQKKWERYGDALSWRREYDLYTSQFSNVFSDSLHWPKCYHAEINGDETQIWMEFIEGTSSNDLTVEMLEHTAVELGRIQGKLLKENPTHLSNISNLGNTEFMRNDYKQWHNQTVEYQYIRSKNCEIPKHLCQMLIDMDTRAEILFEKISKLPVVLCHRDLWLENIFYTEGKSILIDWDTAGWGFMGEDIASLIVDETDTEYLVEYYRKLVPTYYKGVSEYIDVSLIDNDYIWEMILIKFGYRIVHYYMFTKSPDTKKEQVNALEKIYEMKSIS